MFNDHHCLKYCMPGPGQSDVTGDICDSCGELLSWVHHTSLHPSASFIIASLYRLYPQSGPLGGPRTLHMCWPTSFVFIIFFFSCVTKLPINLGEISPCTFPLLIKLISYFGWCIFCLIVISVLGRASLLGTLKAAHTEGRWDQKQQTVRTGSMRVAASQA